jgi:hypothetical protein
VKMSFCSITWALIACILFLTFGLSISVCSKCRI